jgi:hypothetical protein
VSIKVCEPEQMGPCVLCAERRAFYKGYGPEFGVCCACAESIANLYSLVHSGEPLFEAPSAGANAKPVPTALRWRVLREAGFACQACGERERPLHVDHIVSRAKGGGNEPGNLQALCDRCNLKKGAS